MHDGGGHITEPLDYLYEELPPEGMAEVRRHLAECPECRARMRHIRETVKLYRSAGKPRPREGLAARTTAAAIRAVSRPEEADIAALATQGDSGAGDLPPPEVRQASLEAEFNRLKEEVRQEVRTGWRGWFFHPAWTVAASVLFLGTIFIHMSPRWNRQETLYIRPTVEAQGAAKQIRDRDALPAPRGRVERDRPVITASPILQEARAENEIAAVPPPEPSEFSVAMVPSLGETSVSGGSSVMAHQGSQDAAQAVSPAEALPATPREQRERTPFSSPAMGGGDVRPRSMDKGGTISSPLPPGAPLTDLSEERGGMAAPEADSDVSLYGYMPSFSATDPAFDTMAPESESRPPPVDEAVSPRSFKRRMLRPPSAAMAFPVPPSESYSTARLVEYARRVAERHAGQPAAVPENDDLPRRPDTAPPAAATPSDAGVNIIDMLGNFEPPQLIERPTPIDVPERIQSLITLAVMQMDNGEIADAWKTVAMLRAYDSQAAERMASILTRKEQAALGENATTIPSESAVDAGQTGESVPPLPEAAPSKYDALSIPDGASVPAVVDEPAASYSQYLVEEITPFFSEGEALSDSPMASGSSVVVTEAVPNDSIVDNTVTARGRAATAAPDDSPSPTAIPSIEQTRTNAAGQVIQPPLHVSPRRDFQRRRFSTDPYLREN